MTEWISATLILAGALFSFIASIGILRMPDFFLRLQTSTKAVTLGVSCLALGAALQLEGTGVTTQAVLVAAFLLLTSPISSNLLGAAAYEEEVPLWEEVLIDELAENEHGLIAEEEEG